MLIIAFTLLSCNSERKKVTIKFLTDDATYSVEVDKGTNFVNLLEAYNQSKLTHKDILEIYKLHK